MTRRPSALQNDEEVYHYKTVELDELKKALINARDLYLAGFEGYLEVIIEKGSV